MLAVFFPKKYFNICNYTLSLNRIVLFGIIIMNISISKENLNMGEKIVKILLLILLLSFIFALIYKASNPSDYRHPRERSIKLY